MKTPKNKSHKNDLSKVEEQNNCITTNNSSHATESHANVFTKDKFSKVKNGIFIGFISLFIAIISMFPILWICGVSAGENYENRVTAEAPKFQEMFLDYGNFSKNFEDYFKDTLPFRSNIMQTYSLLNYKLFNISIVPKVASVGKNGWLFYEDFGTRGVISGNTKLSQIDLSNILNGIKIKYNDLKSLGKEYVVYIAPEKQSIYPEYDKLENSNYTCADQLVEYLLANNCPAKIIYGKDLLISKKQPGINIYHKYDSHWNTLGAFYGYQQIISEIANLVETPFTIVNDYGIGEEYYPQADLSTALTIGKYLPETAAAISYNDTINITTQTIDEILTVANSNTESNLKVFIYGDSFSQYKYWANCFLRSASEVRFLHNRNNFTTLKGYLGECNVVVEECVARVVTTLGNHA